MTHSEFLAKRLLGYDDIEVKEYSVDAGIVDDTGLKLEKIVEDILRLAKDYSFSYYIVKHSDYILVTFENVFMFDEE